MRPACIVCHEEVEIAAVHACNHFVCAPCALRMRVKMGRKTCCVCNLESERILLTKAVPEDFRAGDVVTDHPALLWDTVLPRCKLLDVQWSLNIDDTADKSILEAVRRLRDPYCRACNRILSSLRDLENHLWNAHHTQLCPLCLQHKAVFVSEQIVYTQNDIYAHMSYERKCRHDPPQFQGHPLCEFCDTNFYDNDQLFDHLHKKHESCHVCRKNGYEFTYYHDLGMLERHFRECHPFCEQPDCPLSLLERVFSTEVDLRFHQSQMHGKGRKGKLDPLELGFTFGEPVASQGDRDRGGKGKGKGKGKGGDSQGHGGGGRPNGRVAPDADNGSSDGLRITFHHSTGPRRSPNLAYSQPQTQGAASSSTRGPPRGGSPVRDNVSSEWSSVPVPGNRNGVPQPSDRSPSSSAPAAPPPSSAPAAGPPATTAEDAAKQRNRELIQRMRERLGEERFKQFRTLSSEFLKGEMLCAEYYRRFVELFGPKSDDIFMEMVTLLPNASKRDALLLAHNHYHSKEFGKPTPNQKKAQDKKAKQQATDSARQQVEEQWPALGPNAPTGPLVPSTPTPPTPAEEFPSLPSSKPKPKPKAAKDPKKPAGPPANVWEQGSGSGKRWARVVKK